MAKLTIGALADQAHCSVPTIRYYEQIDLLPQAERASNGHRYYRDSDLKRLTFIKRCRDFGFSIDQVRALVSLFENGDRSCIEVRDMAQEHLDSVRVKLDEMRQLEASLAAFVDGCDTACSGGATRDCVIVVDLAAADPLLAQRRQSGCCGSVVANQPVKTTATDLKRA